MVEIGEKKCKTAPIGDHFRKTKIETGAVWQSGHGIDECLLVSTLAVLVILDQHGT